MQPARSFLAGRVARRFFLLFVLAALVPLALMVALSTTHVRGTLIEQGERRLATDAKSYGAAAFGRLLDASDVARLTTVTSAERPGERLALQPFDGLTRMSPDGRATRIAGRTTDFAPTAEERARLRSGLRVLRASRAGEATRRIVIAVPLGADPARGWAVASLRPAYLWGDRDDWPGKVEFCVIDAATLAPIHCPGLPPDESTRRALAERTSANATSVAWESEGTALRSMAWGQFLKAEFGVEEWIVIATQPEDDLLRSTVAFHSVFVPTAVLALLVVGWLSLRLIRWTLTPLERLTEATRRVGAHDFAALVEVDRADEFGELASAFNAMTERLGRQFTALSTLAAIDREILSSHDMEHVMRPVLRHMRTLVPASAVGMLLHDQEDRSLGRLCILRDGAAGDLEAHRVLIGSSEREALQRDHAGAWIVAEPDVPGSLRAILDHDVHAVYVHPIIWREGPCGCLVFGFGGQVGLNDEELQQIRELAARMAVAISSAWRDAQLYAQAHFDSLTGLPNRLLFLDRLSQHVVRCEREGARFALLFIDLDHFKNVNDTQGHSHGDVVLAEAARRLLRCVRASDTVARLGGDEFAVTLAELARPGEVDRVVRKILASLAKPFVADGQQSYLGASIGVAVFPGDGAGAEELLRNADTAMYRAKANGRGQVAFYEEKMNREAQERVSLDRELRIALARGDLVLRFQPQVDLRTGAIAGAEALIRWHHAERGTVMPDVFIPVAEASDLIEDIGRWVIRAVCRQDRDFRRQGVTLGRLSVNASVRELHHADFVGFVQRTMQEFGTSANSLEIEVTETLLVERVAEVRRVLDRLKAAGLTIALDDFGVGFASMASLRDFPFDVVKIDKSFVAGLPDSAHSVAIVTATIAISRALGKKVIAEGIETDAQLELLRKMGCDYAQGYVVAPPMAPEAFVDFMRAADRVAARPVRLAVAS
jgi:diguanylate cyclase (GGDEF)-like protein